MKKVLTFVVVIVLVGIIAGQAVAGGVKYANEDGDYLKLGGRIQFQYHMSDPDSGESTDELKFRRLRPYIEGSVHEDWKGKWQFDLGKGSAEIKDAYFQYKGLDFCSIAFGNKNFPFSREFLTSSKKQHLVERTFVGDHNYGAPDRQVGVHVAGGIGDDMIRWDVSVAKGAIDPSNKKLDFDTVGSLNAGADWLEGNMYGGRLEMFPNGYFKPEQGDFKREFKTALAVAAFGWDNDDDNVNIDVDEETGEESYSDADVDSVTGVEVSGALRVAGLSIDAQYNVFDAELVHGSAGSDGIYKDGETTLENFAIEGGFMIVPSKLELAAGYQSQDADGYAKTWNRTSVGANVFVAKHDIKYQVSYRMGENKDGKDGNDVDELFVQAQYVF